MSPPSVRRRVAETPRRHIAHNPVQSGRAEHASHGTTYLRGDAQRVTVSITHEYCLNQVPIRQAEQVFTRPVPGNSHRLDFRVSFAILRDQALAKCLWEVVHLGKRAALLQPLIDLRSTKGLFTHCR